MTKAVWILSIWLFWSSAAWALPISVWNTPQGTKVMHVHAPQLPMVDVRVVFAAGSARDGELEGLAYLFNSLLNEGAGEWDAGALAQRLESRGIEMQLHTGRDMAWVSMRSLSDKRTLTLALDTLATVLSKPRLDPDAIDRVRERMLAQINLQRQSASQVGETALLEALFTNHPYGHDPLGREESLKAIRRADLLAFQSRYYVAANALIVIVGDMDKAQAEQVAKRLVADLPVGEKAPPLPPAQLQPGRYLHRSFPASQTHLYLGLPGIAYTDEDYFPLILGNHVLGGSGLTSILGEEVRNKRGLSYGVYSYFSPWQAGGPWIMTAQTKADQAQSTMQLMRQLLQTFIRQGPTEAQLEAAKKHLIGGFPLKLSSNGKILKQITLMGFYDLPLNWLDVYTTRLQQITPEQVRSAFQKHMRLQHLMLVTVGERALPSRDTH